jgi:choline kinase
VLQRGYQAVLGTGCGHESVSGHVAARGYDGVQCVLNEDFATTNSIVTLWRLREFVRDECLLINGDLVIEPEAFDLFMPISEPQILVKQLRFFDDDTYRVVFDEERGVRRMGKDISDGPSPRSAAFTGISRVGDAARFLREIEKLLQGGVSDTWPTTAYRNLIGEVTVHARDIGEMLFFDVDTPAEHEEARLALQGRAAI